MELWVDSGSPVAIFSMTDLKATLSKANLHLQQISENFMEYNNYRTHLLGNIAVTIALNGWVTQAKESVIAGQRQLILGRALYGRPRFGANREKKSYGNHWEGQQQQGRWSR